MYYTFFRCRYLRPSPTNNTQNAQSQSIFFYKYAFQIIAPKIISIFTENAGYNETKVASSFVSYKDKVTAHPNELATTLLNDEFEPRRLEMFKPADLMKQHI
jgi:hypothetical protein